MSASDNISIVEYYAENEGYRCGYCKSPNTNYSHGMWAHSLSVQDYQDLIDRGWRRSGCYCYKPTMHLTCCPMYTIRCSALDFKLSKSQKKKLKRFNKFLAYGQQKTSTNDNERSESPGPEMEFGDECGIECGINDFPGLKDKALKATEHSGKAVIASVEASFKNRLTAEIDDKIKGDEVSSNSSNDKSINASDGIFAEEDKVASSSKSPVKKGARPGDGIDPSRPLCKKAKLYRKERKEKKIAQLGPSAGNPQKIKNVPVTKSLEDFINEPLPDSPAHRLEIKLVNVVSYEMSQTLETSQAVFAKYQMAIHKEEANECDMSAFTNFLVDSPLKPWKPRDGPPQGYGSFHQQYWLDGRLIAVGVIDILPYCVSSVYFFYDPEFHFLVLGTYGCLRELAFCRSLHHSAPSLKYYYMGFYIHSCPKMAYKGAFSPSFLLCPEVYSWHPIEYCLTLLQKSKYTRFNDDPEAKDPDRVHSICDVSVLFQNEVMYYKTYLSLNQPDSHMQEVTQYASLVGNKLSKRMLLILM